MKEKDRDQKQKTAIFEKPVSMNKEERKQWFKEQWKNGNPIMDGIMNEVKDDRK
ncbi:hypothetical protein [Bacillus sp. 1P06AnD]|uniref:hypothetical protein n=1 Tax=Bacillus sp. 1P06AnD TaxID=3132208 RepID=UPI0039A363F2